MLFFLIYIYNNRWSREKLKLEFLIRVLILCHVSRFILLNVQLKSEIGVQFSPSLPCYFLNICANVLLTSKTKKTTLITIIFIWLFLDRWNAPILEKKWRMDAHMDGKEVYNSYFLFQRRCISKGYSLITIIFSLWIRIAPICN